MAMLLAILVAFGRLSADSEIVGAAQLRPEPLPARPAGRHRSSSSSPSRPPALAMYARPVGQPRAQARRSGTSPGRGRAPACKPQVFNDEFPGLVIYAEQIDSHRRPAACTSSSPTSAIPQQHNTVFAREGFMISDTERRPSRCGCSTARSTRTDATAAQRATRPTSESYDVNLDLRETLAGARAAGRRPEGADHRRSSPAPSPRSEPPASRADRRARRVPPQVRDPVRLRRLRAGRRAARHPAGARRPLARLRREPRRDLRLLHPAVRRAGLRRAGHACRPGVGLWLPNVVFGALGAAALAAGGARAVRSAAALARPARPRAPGAAVAPPRAWSARDDASARRLLLPTLGRHLVREFLRTFALTMLAFVAIYIIADFFDRFDTFLAARRARPARSLRLVPLSGSRSS